MSRSFSSFAHVRSFHRGRLISRPALAALVSSMLALSAAAQTWDGGAAANTNWNDPLNWAPDGIPVNNGSANIFMGGLVDLASTVNVTFDINSLTFNFNGGGVTPYVINASGGATLQIRNGGIINNDIETATINLPITQTGGPGITWNASMGDIVFGGPVTLNLGGAFLNIAGTNDVIVNGQMSGAVQAMTKSGTGELQLNGANTFTGGVTLDAGTLSIGNNSALGTATLTFNAGTIQAIGVSRTIANNVALGGNISVGGTQNLTVSGAVVLTGNRTITTNNSGLAIFSGVVGQNLPGRSLTKDGAGTLRFSGAAANTYTGNTNVHAGTLELAKTAGVNAIPGGTLVIGDNAGGPAVDIVRLLADHQIADGVAVTIASSGLLNLSDISASDAIGSLTLTGGASVATGTGTLSLASGGVTLSPVFSSPTATISGNLSLGAATRTFDIAENSVATDLDVSAVISNGGLLKTGDGTLQFSGSTANTYSGTTTVNGGVLVLNKSDGVVAVPGDLVINGADVIVQSEGQFAASTNVDINSFGQLLLFNNNTINSLTLSDGTIHFLAPSVLTVSGPISVDNVASNSSFPQSGGNTLVLTGSGSNVAVADGPTDLDLAIGIAVNSINGLAKTGAGKMQLTGTAPNSISGTTSVDEGTLLLSKPADVASLGGNIVVGDGIGGANADLLQLGANHQIAQLVTETITVNGSGHFDLNGFTETIGNLQLNAGHVSGGTISVAGSVNSSGQTNSSTISSSVDLLGTTKVFTVDDGPVSEDLLIDGAVTNGNVSKTGAGTLKIAGSAPNTGTVVQVANGTLILEKPTGVNAVDGLIISDSAGPPQSDVVRYGANDHQLPDSINVIMQPAGLLDLNGRSDTIGMLTMNGSGVVETGAGTLTVANQVTSNLSTTAGTINGNLNLGGGIRPFSIANSPVPAIDLTVTAAMSNGTLQKQGPGALALTGSALASPISYQLDAGALSANGLVIAASRSFTQSAGSTFSGTLHNHGALIYNGGTFSGQLVNKPTGATTFNAQFIAGDGITNEGTMTVPADVLVAVNGDGLDNQGTIVLAGGTLLGAGTPNYSNSKLIIGHGEIQSTGATFVNTGNIVVSDGPLALNTVSNAVNQGTITVPAGLELKLLGGGVTQNTGLILVSGGRIAGPAAISNNLGGVVRGGSSIHAPIDNNGGLIHATGTGVLTIAALLGNDLGGELRVDDDATMNVQNSFSSSGTIVLAGSDSTFSGGTITNTGTIRGPGRLNNVVINNGGTIRAENGTLTLSAAGQVNGGRIEAGSGSQVIYSQGLIQNNGQVALTGGAFDNNNAPLNNLGHIAGFGTLRTGGLTNTGTISVGGELDVLGGVAQNATVSTQTNSTVRFFGPVSGPGSYAGSGTVMFLNSFSPGASPAAVSFGGNVVFDGAAMLHMEVAGTAPGAEFDTLNIAGAATLAGALDVSFLDGFVPAGGNTFELITAVGGISGTFDSEQLPSLSGGLSLELLYAPTAVSLVAAGVLGDYNYNGVVDAADYAVWQDTLGSTSALAADGDASGTVDAGDYDVWKAHFGEIAVSGAAIGSIETSAAVPEATSLFLALAALVGIRVVLLRNRRRC